MADATHAPAFFRRASRRRDVHRSRFPLSEGPVDGVTSVLELKDLSLNIRDPAISSPDYPRGGCHTAYFHHMRDKRDVARTGGEFHIAHLALHLIEVARMRRSVHSFSPCVETEIFS